ncbi:MAG: SDR family oxidoreductase [Myxococcales bacterium]|nr:SDR family oxidoreductase [Myxococcales bacterium]
MIRSGVVHFVTGATGFVGGALVLRLLETTTDEIVALVRPGDVGAEPRMHESLRVAAKAYGHDSENLPLTRVRAIAGDVCQPLCGISHPIPHFDVVWHSAASLRYEDRFEREIFDINLGGTLNVLELAKAAGATVLNQISTAYVAGSTNGVIAEQFEFTAPTNNHYERSKVHAERATRAADGIKVHILRPGIVVGHSQTLAATTFSGLYGFTRQMVQFKGVMERMQRGMMNTHRIRFRANPHQRLSLVPVDEVAAQAVHIGLSPNASGVYHLTQNSPPTVSETLTAVTRATQFLDPEFVDEDQPLDWLDEKLDERLEFYRSYISGDKHFDRSRADNALDGRADLYRKLPSVPALVEWYLERLEKERAAVPAAR